MKTLFSHILAAAFIISFACAQELIYFNLDQLGVQSQLVEVSDTYPTIIEFDGEITEAAPTREERLTFTFSGDKIWLTGLVNKGEAGLTVIVNDKTAMFRIFINPDLKAPKRYVVTTPEPAKPKQVGTLTLPSREGVSSQPDPGQKGGAVPAERSGPPPYVFEATLQDHTIHYKLDYTGGYLLVNDIKRLRVKVNGEYLSPSDLRYERVDEDGYLNRVSRKGSESGLIALPPGISGPITLEWSLVEIGTGRTFKVERTL